MERRPEQEYGKAGRTDALKAFVKVPRMESEGKVPGVSYSLMTSVALKKLAYSTYSATGLLPGHL